MTCERTDQTATREHSTAGKTHTASPAAMSHDRFRSIMFDVETWMEHARNDRQYGYWWGFACGVRRHYRGEHFQPSQHDHYLARADEVGRGYRDGLSMARGEPVRLAEMLQRSTQDCGMALP